MKCPEVFGFVACCVGFSVAMLAGIASDSVALAVVGGVVGFAGVRRVGVGDCDAAAVGGGLLAVLVVM